MKRRFTIFLCLLLGCILCSCGTMRVNVNSAASFSKENPITITNASDESGSLEMLQALLRSNGYTLISPSTIKNGQRLNKEIINSTTAPFTYVLTMDYYYYWDVFYYSFTYFAAVITDSRSGDIVMTFYFVGDKSVKAVLSGMVTEMNKVMN